MSILSFRAIGIPKAQPRAKACIRGRHAGVYDPGTADDWKTVVRNAALAQWDRRIIEVPVTVLMQFHLPRPKSHYKRDELRDNAPSWVTTKPDLDNLEKAVLDALTNIGLWRDDAQVVGVLKTKSYADGLPCATVDILTADEILAAFPALAPN